MKLLELDLTGLVNPSLLTRSHEREFSKRALSRYFSLGKAAYAFIGVNILAIKY